MKTMKIEKILEMEESILEVFNLTVKEALSYEPVAEGIRAVGPVYINGNWRSSSSTYPIQEVLEFDVLAPQAKLNNEPFSLEAVGIRSEILDHELCLELTFLVHGLKDEKEEIPPVEEVIANEEMIETDEELIEFEDLLEDDEATYTTYRFAIARNDDTYHDIASRYGVSEVDLRELNHEKPIPFKTLVLLPIQNDMVK